MAIRLINGFTLMTSALRTPFCKPTSAPSALLSFVLIAFIALVLSACGFQLRGPKPMAFKTIYLEMSPYSELAADLKRQIRTSGTTVAVDKREDAEVRFVVLEDSQEKAILSLGPTGTVREYQLRKRFAFRLHDKAGREVLPLQQINITRDITYSDSIVLAKDQEEALLYRDMQSDLVQQISRRLAAVRMTPVAPDAEPAVSGVPIGPGARP
ncbi:LPS assembly lipoprotein LptE [Uliginosibacterium sp. H3]|uniref:LPS-assembly lipoprotein LptE n=1 Tax=Uliginosibacterium silvisoli TaxID=3114758 RepID=A0ABU6K3I5_9RHOO|nr:LPS assembly lipoprotein LptE [Uliginosibacterium sp. H3]